MKRLQAATIAFVASVAAGCAENAPSTEPQPDAAPPADAAILPRTDACEGAWCRMDLPLPAVSLNAIWGSGADDVWIVGSPAVTMHWNGTRLESNKIATNQSLFGIWGSGKNDVWTFATGNSVWHHSGVGSADAWARSNGKTETDPDGTPTPLYAMWGRSATDIWAVGASFTAHSGELQPPVLHCDGWRDGAPDWRASPTGFGEPATIEPITLNAICGHDTAGVWIAGSGGKVRHSSGWKDDAAVWSAISSRTSRDLYALWCSPDGMVWAAGEAGLFRRFYREAEAWTVEEVGAPATTPVRAMWGLTADDAWAVGDAGLVLHWDGKGWKRADDVSGANGVRGEDLFAVWGSSATDIWIAGRNLLLHRSTQEDKR